MIRAVLDANVFVIALLHPAGPPGRILVHWLEDRTVALILWPGIVDELKRALRYDKVRRRLDPTDQELHTWVAALEFLADGVPPSCPRRIPGDSHCEAEGVSPDHRLRGLTTNTSNAIGFGLSLAR